MTSSLDLTHHELVIKTDGLLDSLFILHSLDMISEFLEVKLHNSVYLFLEVSINTI